MNWISILLDVGNLIVFTACLPQLIRAFKLRKKDPPGVSFLFLLGYASATLLFATVGFMTGAYIALGTNIITFIVFIAQIYWKRRYRNVQTKA